MTTVDVRMLAAAAATVLLKLAIGYLVLTHRRGSKSKREHAPRGDASAVPRHGAASEIKASMRPPLTLYSAGSMSNHGYLLVSFLSSPFVQWIC